MKDKKKIFVLMGGRSPEYEISLISGKEVVRNLDNKKFNVLPVIVSRDSGTWKLVSPNNLLNAENPLDLKGTKKEFQVRQAKKILSLRSIEMNEKPIVFIAMHGPFGEDGTIQGMLELSGLKYTGSGVLASALGMDKIMFRKVLEKENVPIPKYIVLKKGEKIINIDKKIGKYPYFIKPSNQGSSVGSSIAKNKEELNKSINEAFKFSNPILIDEYLKGKEVTCGLLGNDNPLALPIVEIIPKKSVFFDYKSKYYEGGAEEIVPARISKKLTKQIQDVSIKVHKILGCRGFSRVDFIIKDNKNPMVLEINTIPGLTSISLLPKAAKAAGISYKKLLEKIIKYAEE
ncbi:D-alanine--D-alanine ligase [Patescibacteria group bacterium]|nr:D-alanine--D-alanine ligase [Patescibacteria group bacterium]